MGEAVCHEINEGLRGRVYLDPSICELIMDTVVEDDGPAVFASVGLLVIEQSVSNTAPSQSSASGFGLLLIFGLSLLLQTLSR